METGVSLVVDLASTATICLGAGGLYVVLVMGVCHALASRAPLVPDEGPDAGEVPHGQV